GTLSRHSVLRERYPSASHPVTQHAIPGGLCGTGAVGDGQGRILLEVGAIGGEAFDEGGKGFLVLHDARAGADSIHRAPGRFPEEPGIDGKRILLALLTLECAELERQNHRVLRPFDPLGERGTPTLILLAPFLKGYALPLLRLTIHRLPPERCRGRLPARHRPSVP